MNSQSEVTYSCLSHLPKWGRLAVEAVVVTAVMGVFISINSGLNYSTQSSIKSSGQSVVDTVTTTRSKVYEF